MPRKKKEIEIKLNREDEPKLRTPFHRPTKAWKEVRDKLNSIQDAEDLDEYLDEDI
jgi:hypothetical protein